MGYIDISQTCHLFFYFFKSRTIPDKDDVVFWTNRGTRLASLFSVLDMDGPKYHPESWNTNANTFFIDHPIATGFSYGEMITFMQFKGHALHMVGELYGGWFLPLFAVAVYDNNALLRGNGWPPINLRLVMIGNRLTDSITMVLSYYDMECTPASIHPTLDISTCIVIKSTICFAFSFHISRCEKWMQDTCMGIFDFINCGAAYSFGCTDIGTPYARTSMSNYYLPICCYPMTKHISEYLSLPSMCSLLGVDPEVPQNFSCNEDIINSFHTSQDELHPTITKDYISTLLKRGIKVLIYAYTSIEWSGQKEFVSERLREWRVDGKVTEKMHSAKGLTFATVDGVGHFSPYDKPKEMLVLLQQWIMGEAL
ncbi:Alpha/Beta hydrolase protein [Armillaria fumosa]|nr:Alpha/Beta hydrolase protein [Armillaria fumosa]